MKYATALVFSAFFAGQLWAADGAQTDEGTTNTEEPMSAVEVNLSDFLWLKRPIVVFADTPADPRFQRQMDLLAARPEALEERDVVILVDTDPEALGPLRKKLRPRGFMLALIGKDGGVKLRKPFPWDVRELSRAIDKMPTRLQELRDKRAAQEPVLND